LDEDSMEVPNFSNQTVNGLYFVKLSALNILRILRHLALIKAIDPDNTPNVVLKSCRTDLAEQLSLVFWIFIAAEIFPKIFHLFLHKSIDVILVLKPVTMCQYR